MLNHEEYCWKSGAAPAETATGSQTCLSLIIAHSSFAKTPNLAFKFELPLRLRHIRLNSLENSLPIASGDYPLHESLLTRTHNSTNFNLRAMRNASARLAIQDTHPATAITFASQPLIFARHFTQYFWIVRFCFYLRPDPNFGKRCVLVPAQQLVSNFIGSHDVSLYKLEISKSSIKTSLDHKHTRAISYTHH